MTNVWGYSHLSFFAPMARIGSQTSPGGGSDPAAAAREFKEMVKALHAAGIEVILDVVYNHTAEGAPATTFNAFHAFSTIRRRLTHATLQPSFLSF